MTSDTSGGVTPMAIDGHYIIQNFVRKPSDEAGNLRVIEKGVTWSTLELDMPMTIELRPGGEIWVGPILRDEAGNEVREPLAHGGTWTVLPDLLELTWHHPRRWTERLVAKDPKKHPRAPGMKRPLGRRDPVLGLLVYRERYTNWRGELELEGRRTDVSIDDQPVNREGMFERARHVIDVLRTDTLASLKQQLAEEVYPEYDDWMRDLQRPAQPTPEALAASMRVDTIAIDKGGIVTLWFGHVLGEHSILGILSRDCTTATLSHP